MIANAVGMHPATLRHKLNPAQPHQLTLSELIAITDYTEDLIVRLAYVITEKGNEYGEDVQRVQSIHSPACSRFGSRHAPGEMCEGAEVGRSISGG
ncbi:phage regulatory CII family protein [Cronobacter turicensis]|nr:phage regulatory CII family protein [Cronobacter turicensis]ELY4385994.1 phage regulatory CII family protein [Cronobacter turicensis]ELY6270233.1 phage regulatory CII family protein [Cronobacter turicensis]